MPKYYIVNENFEQISNDKQWTTEAMASGNGGNKNNKAMAKEKRSHNTK